MMKKTAGRVPFFLLLLPLFFVLHGFQENYGFVNIADALLLLLTYCLAALLLYAACYWLLRKPVAAAIAACSLLAFYLFFGSIQDFLKSYAPFFSRYSVLLPAFLVFFACLCIFLKRSTPIFLKFNLYLNLLLVVYLFLEIGKIGWKEFHPVNNKFATYSFRQDSSYTVCKDCPRPDIYFILFDAYTGTRTLCDRYGFDNSGLDTFFLKRGFALQGSSRSNYYFTVFSMASMLSMSYLNGIPDQQAVTPEDYNRCTNLIKDNNVIRFMSQQGYDIVNYSVFDLAGNPSMVQESFLPVKTKLITAATLFPRLERDIGWRWGGGRLYTTLHNNNRLISAVETESRRVSTAPRFVYAHIYLPHAPFYYNKSGRLKNDSTIYREREAFSLPAYLDYLPYTNNRVKELVQVIRHNTKDKAVIIFMGDHGFNNAVTPADAVYTFQNQNAVYFPDKDYHLLYDSITGVNQFRVIFNTLFKQHFPMIKDSVVFLKDKK